MQLDENLNMHSIRPNSDVQAVIIFFNFAFLCELCGPKFAVSLIYILSFCTGFPVLLEKDGESNKNDHDINYTVSSY